MGFRAAADFVLLSDRMDHLCSNWWHIDIVKASDKPFLAIRNPVVSWHMEGHFLDRRARLHDRPSGRGGRFGTGGWRRCSSTEDPISSSTHGLLLIHGCITPMLTCHTLVPKDWTADARRISDGRSSHTVDCLTICTATSAARTWYTTCFRGSLTTMQCMRLARLQPPFHTSIAMTIRLFSALSGEWQRGASS